MKKRFLLLLTTFTLLFSVNTYASDHGTTCDPETLAYIDSLSEKEGTEYIPEGISTPSSYDPRPLNKVTSVKDQGSDPYCWAYSEVAAMESSLIAAGLATNSIDLSESFVVKHKAVAPSGMGPVLESHSSADKNTRDFNCIEEYYMRSFDNATIKELITKFGGVVISYYHSDSYSGTRTPGYDYNYCYSGNNAPNHDVEIVGWNDNYSKTNFIVQPAGNGAWLCKNSWGTTYDSGFFWMSYYSSIDDITAYAFTNATASKVAQKDLYVRPNDDIIITSYSVPSNAINVNPSGSHNYGKASILNAGNTKTYKSCLYDNYKGQEGGGYLPSETCTVHIDNPTVKAKVNGNIYNNSNITLKAGNTVSIQAYVESLYGLSYSDKTITYKEVDDTDGVISLNANGNNVTVTANEYKGSGAYGYGGVSVVVQDVNDIKNIGQSFTIGFVVYKETVNNTPSTPVTPTQPQPQPTTPATPAVTIGTVKTVNGTSYKISGTNTVEYMGNKKATKKVTIPSQVRIDGVLYNVTSVGNKAFYKNKKITSVVISKNITSIGSYAFYGCTNLETVTIKSKVVKKVGSKAFKGTNNTITFKAPKSYAKKYKKLFLKASVCSKGIMK